MAENIDAYKLNKSAIYQLGLIKYQDIAKKIIKIFLKIFIKNVPNLIHLAAEHLKFNPEYSSRIRFRLTSNLFRAKFDTITYR